MSDDQDWRLKAELDTGDTPSRLERVVHGVRKPDVAGEAADAVAHDVVVTHDGTFLFAYADSRAAVAAAREAIEAVLRRDGVRARISISHWDAERDEWAQVDPPLTDEEKRASAAIERDEDSVEERTLVVSAGKMVRGEVEQTMRDWATRLGLECALIEHPHLLTTQIAFTVTGPRRKVDEFASALRAEELATMRTEREVMISPL